MFQSDGGREFTIIRLRQHVQNSVILHQKSCPYTLVQNLAYRKHKHLVGTRINVYNVLKSSTITPLGWRVIYCKSSYRLRLCNIRHYLKFYITRSRIILICVSLEVHVIHVRDPIQLKFETRLLQCVPRL